MSPLHEPVNPHDGLGAPAFTTRAEAGRRLARRLAQLDLSRPLVLGIPRGGVPVAAEVARALDADLDIVVARKIGAPGSPELAIGAVTVDGAPWLDLDAIVALGVSEGYLQAAVAQARAEAQRRERELRAGLSPLPASGRTVIVIDDGLATGATVRAALRAVRRQKPARLILAVPVGARESCLEMRAEADDVVCLVTPEPFWAVGLHYADFSQVPDEAVRQILLEHRQRRAGEAVPPGDPAPSV